MAPADHSRRSFVKACGKVAAITTVLSGWLPPPVFAMDDTPKLKLVDKEGKPIKAGSLEVQENYIFQYPYISTPCLLLRLDAPTAHEVERKDAKGVGYLWPGGVGKDRAVVAYLAICSHTLSYNSRENSFLTYSDAPSQITGRSRVITCCAHASAYDPADGAKVLAGPAEFPLAAVQLNHEAETDELSAVGFVGTAVIGEFFDAYRAHLNEEYGRGGYRELLEGQTTVLPIAEYSNSVVSC